jgi:hypothetical protein
MPDIVGNGDDLGDHIATRSLKQIKGTDVASADAITLQADGNTFDVTGTTTINHITSTNWIVGSVMILHFDGAVTLTNNAGGLSGAECNILLSGDVNYTTSAGDILTLLLHDSTNWQEISRNSSGSVSDASITFAKIQNLATMKTIGRTAGGTGVSSEVAILDEDNMASDSAVSLSTQQSIRAYVDAQAHSTVTASSTTTFTNKTIDQDATGNSITNIADASIKTSAGIAQSKIANLTTDLSGKSPTAGNTSLTTTGALNAGSITSGFGTINNGSSTITTTGATATGALTVTGVITGSTNVVLNAQGALRLNDSNNSNYAGFKAPANVTTSYDLIMPPATGTTGQVLKMTGTANTLEWGSAGGGATIVHTYTNTTNTAYLGTASSFGTVGAGDRDIYIKMIDTNNEGVFTKIWKNGSATEVQIA